MSNKLANLHREGKINEVEYINYLLYATSDLGIRYLKEKLDAIVLEEPPLPELCGWVDGRRSVWREIKLMILKVDKILNGESKK